MIDHLKRVIGPLERRVRSMLMRGTLAATDDSQDLQQLQVTRLEGETLDGCERIGQYGFTSFAPNGSEVVIAQIGSNPDHQVILGVDDKSRPHPLTAGQVAIYDGAGTKIVLYADGSIRIIAGGTVTIEGGSIYLAGPTTINGNLHVTGNVAIDDSVTVGGTPLDVP